MQGTELLWEVYAWLPLVFALDVAAFHLTGDHPLALRWWLGRSRRAGPRGSDPTRRPGTGRARSV